MRPRMYGSTDMNWFRTTTWPSPALGVGVATSSKSLGLGQPCGRAARRISRFMRAGYDDKTPLDRRRHNLPPSGDVPRPSAAGSGAPDQDQSAVVVAGGRHGFDQFLGALAEALWHQPLRLAEQPVDPGVEVPARRLDQT